MCSSLWVKVKIHNLSQCQITVSMGQMKFQDISIQVETFSLNEMSSKYFLTNAGILSIGHLV